VLTIPAIEAFLRPDSFDYEIKTPLSLGVLKLRVWVYSVVSCY